MEEDKSSLLLWVIGGGAILVGLVMAMKGSAGGTTIVSGGGNSAAASAIAANNTAYNTAALAAHTADVKSVSDLEAIRLGYKTAVTTNAQQNEANFQLSQLEHDFTLRNNQLTFDAAQRALAESDRTQLSISQLDTQAKIQQAELDKQAKEAQARATVDVANAQKPTFWQSLFGAAAGIFGHH